MKFVHAKQVFSGYSCWVVFVLPVLPQPVRTPEYWITLLNYIGLYSIVAIGLVLLTGIGGMTSFGQRRRSWAVGAYSTAYLTDAVWSVAHGLR